LLSFQKTGVLSKGSSSLSIQKALLFGSKNRRFFEKTTFFLKKFFLQKALRFFLVQRTFGSLTKQCSRIKKRKYLKIPLALLKSAETN
jgi:hypothetical protein